jgi:hypothetical protein
MTQASSKPCLLPSPYLFVPQLSINPDKAGDMSRRSVVLFSMDDMGLCPII